MLHSWVNSGCTPPQAWTPDPTLSQVGTCRTHRPPPLGTWKWKSHWNGGIQHRPSSPHRISLQFSSQSEPTGAHAAAIPGTKDQSFPLTQRPPFLGTNSLGASSLGKHSPAPFLHRRKGNRFSQLTWRPWLDTGPVLELAPCNRSQQHMADPNSRWLCEVRRRGI